MHDLNCFSYRYACSALAALAFGVYVASPLIGVCSPMPLAERPQSGQAGDALKEGLAVWRMPDKSGAACASCHSPDGIELAAYAFDDATILRRATPHIGHTGGLQVVQYIHALRSAKGITKGLDPMANRPMQPGGEVLSGATASDRDLAFGRTLPLLLPNLMGKPIDSIEAARKARDEVLALNPSKMRIGIPFNRLSEDVFHGIQHATIADWLPDTPVRAPLATVVRLSDAYLKSPGDDGLRALLDGIEKASPAPRSSADQLAFAKYRSMLVFQHELRKGKQDSSGSGPEMLAKLRGPTASDPMWEVAEIARMNSGTTAASFGLPSDVIVKKSTGPSFSEQMKQIRLSWYWAGWLMDQGLQHSGFFRETQRADYFSRFLLEEGPYPIHCAFMLTRKLAVHSFVPDAWMGLGTQHIELNYSFLVLRDGLERFEPKAPEAKRLFRSFACNSFRMNLFLLADELERTRLVAEPKPPLDQQIRLISAYLAKAAPEHAARDTALESRASKAVAGAAFVRR
ncbi:MAG: hypothetical protein ACHQ50_00180 [Fimbriimonadales bacterium]